MAILLPIILVITQLLSFSSATDIITQSQPLPDDGTTLVSKDGTFELGFFSPGTSTNRYLGIWYKNVPDRTVVWVANRETPLKNDTNSTTSSRLSITTEGHLVLLSQNDTIVWSANSTTTKGSSLNPSTAIAQLLESGNLVLRNEEDQSSEEYAWQSFDYPTDTFLPGMKIGRDLRKGINRELRAWKSWDNPSGGDLRWGMVVGVTPELVMWKGEEEYYRSGPWNGEIDLSIRENPISSPRLFECELVFFKIFNK